mgnify:CR=1 FL=1
MDLVKLKNKIDIKAEYESYLHRYIFKLKELKREEIKNIFKGFKNFFKNEGGFKFKENEHSIKAEYKNHYIVLDIDIYKNIESKDFFLEGSIKTFEKSEFGFFADGVCEKELIFHSADENSYEGMVADIAFFKEFLEGKINYSFKYKISGRPEVYDDIEGLMNGL